MTTAFGNESTTSIDGPVSNATINNPRGISFHPITQEIYIAENGGGNIRAWNRTSQTVRTIVSLGSWYPLYLDFFSDGTLYITTNKGLDKLFTNGMYFRLLQMIINLYILILNRNLGSIYPK